MSEQLVPANHPFRIAIVGAGPAGLYAAEALSTALGERVAIDLFERWPTPFGLLRFGVAPDALSTKKTVGWFDRVLGDLRLRLWGNVRVGVDLGVNELRSHYHQVLLATGASRARSLGIPGETLPGCLDAAELIGWYNAHPEHESLAVDFGSIENLVLIGMGNTALDMTRVLLRPVEELARTDMAFPAVSALRTCRLQRVTILARRGAAEAAFDYRELEKIAALSGVRVEVDAPELDPKRARTLEARKVVELLAALKAQPAAPHQRTVSLRFQQTPVEVIGSTRVTAVRVEHRARESTGAWARTGRTEVVAADLVVVALGFQGQPLHGVPFDSEAGVAHNQQGRVGPGLYVAGWFKRGARGLLGTTKADARETVEQMLLELSETSLAPRAPAERIEELLRARGVQVVGLADWHRLDRLEVERGRALGKAREKYGSVSEMLRALGKR